LRGITDEVDDLLRGGLALLEPEIVPLEGVLFVAHAEGAAVGTAVGEIDVEIVPDLVDVSIHSNHPIFGKSLAAFSQIVFCRLSSSSPRSSASRRTMTGMLAGLFLSPRKGDRYGLSV